MGLFNSPLIPQGYKDGVEDAQRKGGGLLGGIKSALGIEGGAARIPDELKGVDKGGHMAGQSGLAAGFADQSQRGFQQYGQQAQGALDHLGQTMRGQNSVSQEQLRQGLGQQLASQASMAASARPGQGAMAARSAAMNMGRAQSGMAGQAALAGIAERNAAAAQYGGLLQGLRGQDLQATMGSRAQALGGYGDIERLRAQRAAMYAGLPTDDEQLRSLIVGGLLAATGKGGG